MQPDWLRKEQHWLCCTLSLNIVLVDKKQQHLNAVAVTKSKLISFNKLMFN